MTETIDQLIQIRFEQVANRLDDSDWKDVLSRANIPAFRKTPRSRRNWVAMVALAVAAIVFLVAPALGIGPPALDFFSAKHASKQVALDFDRLNVGNSKGMSPRVIAGQTRLVETYHLRSGRPFPLTVAPTRKGTFCFAFGGGGTCSGHHVPSRDHAGDMNSGAIGLGITGAFRSTVLDGYVYDKRMTQVQVRFRNQNPVTIPLLWISPPIDAGFFFYDLTEFQRTHHSVVAVVALDRRGKPPARIGSIFRPMPAWANWRNVADLSKRHVILRSGDATIAIAPSRTGGNCFWLRSASGGASGCAPPRYLTKPMAGGLSGTIFSAQVKPAVSRVELRFQDGARAALRPIQGFVLYSIPRVHWTPGHRLTTALSYAAAGQQLARQSFDPTQIGIYPCKKPRPIGAGETACP
jgi:hypothetical protein